MDAEQVGVGFIGIGQMGRRMSSRLLDRGYNLVVHDVRRDAAAELLAKGAQWAGTPSEVATLCRVVISSLPNPSDVENVIYAPGGLLEAWRNGDIFIDMSTNSPATIRRIAESARRVGASVLDAPVSGGVAGAETGTLTIMVGGEATVLDKVKPILEAMGKNIFHVGDVGCGNVAKLVNNMISLVCTAATAEGFVLGVKAGVDPQTLWEIISRSTGNSWALQQYPRTVLQGDFAPGFRLALATKDISLAVQMGRDCSVPLAIAGLVEQKLIEAKAAGLGDKGVDALILPLERLADVEVRSGRGESDSMRWAK